jgi:hypothetical protein
MQVAGAAGKGGSKTQTPIPLAQTGQTTSLASGDDGDLRMGVPLPSPRFTDAGDAVIDNLTGLMWLKDLDCMATNYPQFDQYETVGDGLVQWQQALDFITEINAGTYPLCGAGYVDWRLPNIHELLSLVDWSGSGPSPLVYLPADHPFVRLVPSADDFATQFYWSSTTVSGSSPSGSFASRYLGFTLGEVRWNYWNAPFLVWPVRGGKTAR